MPPVAGAGALAMPRDALQYYQAARYQASTARQRHLQLIRQWRAAAGIFREAQFFVSRPAGSGPAALPKAATYCASEIIAFSVITRRTKEECVRVRSFVLQIAERKLRDHTSAQTPNASTPHATPGDTAVMKG